MRLVVPESYAVLGLQPGCSFEQLRMARALARRHWRAAASSGRQERRTFGRQQLAEIESAAAQVCSDLGVDPRLLRSEEQEPTLPKWLPITIPGVGLGALSAVVLLLMCVGALLGYVLS